MENKMTGFKEDRRIIIMAVFALSMHMHPLRTATLFFIQGLWCNLSEIREIQGFGRQRGEREVQYNAISHHTLLWS